MPLKSFNKNIRPGRLQVEEKRKEEKEERKKNETLSHSNF